MMVGPQRPPRLCEMQVDGQDEAAVDGVTVAEDKLSVVTADDHPVGLGDEFVMGDLGVHGGALPEPGVLVGEEVVEQVGQLLLEAADRGRSARRDRLGLATGSTPTVRRR